MPSLLVRRAGRPPGECLERRGRPCYRMPSACQVRDASGVSAEAGAGRGADGALPSAPAPPLAGCCSARAVSHLPASSPNWPLASGCRPASCPAHRSNMSSSKPLGGQGTLFTCTSTEMARPGRRAGPPQTRPPASRCCSGSWPWIPLPACTLADPATTGFLTLLLVPAPSGPTSGIRRRWSPAWPPGSSGFSAKRGLPA